MTLIVNNYLREETFQYKDETTNFELVDGGKWYFIEIERLLNNELLQKEQMEALQLKGDEVQLPKAKGIGYSGKGVQFEYGGKRYDATATNLAVLQEALQTGDVPFYWNRDRFRKYGGTTDATIDVYVTDKAGRKIPDLSLHITIQVTE